MLNVTFRSICVRAACGLGLAFGLAGTACSAPAMAGPGGEPYLSWQNPGRAQSELATYDALEHRLNAADFDLSEGYVGLGRGELGNNSQSGPAVAPPPVVSRDLTAADRALGAEPTRVASARRDIQDAIRTLDGAAHGYRPHGAFDNADLGG